MNENIVLKMFAVCKFIMVPPNSIITNIVWHANKMTDHLPSTCYHHYTKQHYNIMGSDNSSVNIFKQCNQLSSLWTIKSLFSVYEHKNCVMFDWFPKNCKTLNIIMCVVTVSM